MAVMLMGVFNSIGITNKGRDARRKKDLNRIKIAFEEYFNDKGYYPKDDLVEKLMDKDNCGKSIDDFPYLHPWPCDPNNSPYTIMVGINKFVATTYLENEEDKDIPNVKTMLLANYGVSSSNILWYDGLIYEDNCAVGTCIKCVAGEACVSVNDIGCIGDNCFLQDYYGRDKCKVKCCGPKCDDL